MHTDPDLSILYADPDTVVDSIVCGLIHSHAAKGAWEVSAVVGHYQRRSEH